MIFSALFFMRNIDRVNPVDNRKNAFAIELISEMIWGLLFSKKW